MSKDKEYHKDETFYTQCQETSSTNSLYPRKKKKKGEQERRVNWKNWTFIQSTDYDIKVWVNLQLTKF